MADISKVSVNGTEYDVKDTVARQKVEELAGVKHYLGVTSTELTDGAATNPVTIGTESVTVTSGQFVIYGKKEFIFADDNTWHEFGDVSGLKKLAYKDSAVATYKPAGEVKVTPSTGTVKQITDVGTLPTLTTSVEGETLTINFDQGKLPTSGDATVVTGINSASFDGTQATITSE